MLRDIAVAFVPHKTKPTVTALGFASRPEPLLAFYEERRLVGDPWHPTVYYVQGQVLTNYSCGLVYRKGVDDLSMLRATPRSSAVDRGRYPSPLTVEVSSPITSLFLSTFCTPNPNLLLDDLGFLP